MLSNGSKVKKILNQQRSPSEHAAFHLVTQLTGVLVLNGSWERVLTRRDMLVRSNRLTDYTDTKLTQFYGQEDFATLQNILHRIPNIVPIPFENSSNNNDADDTKISKQLGTISETAVANDKDNVREKDRGVGK